MQIKTKVMILAGCLLTLLGTAQEKNKIKFGRISPEDFQKTSYDLDTGAHAVVLADIGSSEFEAEQSYFRLVYKRHRRVKILDKTGYDAATEELYLFKYSGNREDKVSNLKAATYNLENGKVVETPLESKGIFTENMDEDVIRKKFTLPAVKEGSIVEYSYTIYSPSTYSLKAWNFQGEYPCLWSEYTVGIPEFFDYIFIAQGYHPFDSKTREEVRKSFTFRFEQQGAYGTKTGATESQTVGANVSMYRWVAKDVPALKDESFTTSIRNHITRIEFQQSARKFPGQPIEPVMTTWPKLREDLMKDESYGIALGKNNGFMGDEVEMITAGATSDEEKARKIYYYVRNNYSCTDHSSLAMDKPLRTVFKGRSGNVSEINMVLVAMLRKAGLNAYPVILSTRGHGFANPLYPMINRFNYTIAEVGIGDRIHFLDASYPLGFDKLHASCYNGHARILDEDVTAVQFDADSLLEQKLTSIILRQENGMLKGALQQRPTYFESYFLRGQVKDKGKEEYFKPLEKVFTKVSNTSIDDLDSLEGPVMVKYDFEYETNGEDMVYLNPMFNEATKTNPFKSLDRKYPVEMPSTVDEIYTLNMEIPEGYDVEELPKSTMVKFNEDEGLFQYMIARTENIIQFRSRIKLNKATFPPEEYATLRDFFDMIVKKQGEQIVLKKKK
ncbi:MAG TPA: transglutaminase domain-containing protein [Chitinophaga sp.]